jgi:hypothetical protein
MPKKKITYPRKFMEQVKAVTNRRAKIVIGHIVEHGFITTEDLEKTYGYNHPPRAARDVREAGIPLETFKVKSKAGKSIAAYKFGKITALQSGRMDGRASFSKGFKKQLYELGYHRCGVCNGEFEARYLQIDHRAPYEVAGDTSSQNTDDFMLLCGSCNRAKSWSCEHCSNWKTAKDATVCTHCYWGNPTVYDHIALKPVRRVDLYWTGDEIKYYDAIKIIARHNKVELPDFIKQVVSEKCRNNIIRKTQLR